jgi:hypothetical protein
MNQPKLPTTIGAAFAGGFFAGLINVDGGTFALIVSPKAAGEHKAPWNAGTKTLPGAQSYSDGMQNTTAMAEAGSDLAEWARGLDIEGHTDWYIPSRDELELMYRNLKPTGQENYESFRDGDNPSSAPVGYPYTEALPGQTSVEAFKDGKAESIDPVWHWSSTQYAAGPSYAWYQGFNDGYQDDGHRSYEGRARAVRRLAI